jgi:hypothetical protein
MTDIVRAYALKPLPALPPTQRWRCDGGCGETLPGVDQIERGSETSPEGDVISSTKMAVWRSACCGQRLFIFDHATGSSTDWSD